MHKYASNMYTYGTVRLIDFPGSGENKLAKWLAGRLAGAAWRLSPLAGWPDGCWRSASRPTANLNCQPTYCHPICWLAQGPLAGRNWLPTRSNSSVAGVLTEFFFFRGFPRIGLIL